ncbi:uncharacterized protein GGS25DRAFT_516950 [Hypoxylon fragiforme]|uniref:uncharacterized protein n=1 Tax=Hypoxylon fragiforme TaxID=63214 RepID=UPI0020C67932|nr:uncharacterized protein GGS25DRAFT_516950 [Hypoxylon fragiforme]KAI2614097.1 hypothetical protein GGS25DRAFT_516950 [Hypoxylon fragiforme]
MRTSISLLAILAPLAFADGPCDPTVCEEVTSSDGVFCWMPIVLGWENASADPKDVLACASSPEVMCQCYGCEPGLERLITENNLCPAPSGSA